MNTNKGQEAGRSIFKFLMVKGEMVTMKVKDEMVTMKVKGEMVTMKTVKGIKGEMVT